MATNPEDLNALKARIAKLEKALRPFAMKSSLPDDRSIAGLPAALLITVGDLRRADAALTPERMNRNGE